MLALLVVLAVAPSDIMLDVPLFVRADIDDDVLELALEEVDDIFAAGGIRLRFDIAPSESVDNPTVTVLLLARPARSVITGCSRNKHDHRLGHTSFRTKQITLWSEQIIRAVDGDWDRRDLPRVSKSVYARAVGRVLAHELGHLLMRLYRHRDGGLMRASFSHSALTAKSNRKFRMSESDFRQVRAFLERLQKRSHRRLDSRRRQRAAESVNDDGDESFQPSPSAPPAVRR